MVLRPRVATALSSLVKLMRVVEVLNFVSLLDLLGFMSVLCPVSPISLVYPISKGRCLGAWWTKELEKLAASNACTQPSDQAEKKRFKLARDVRAAEKKLGRELTPGEVIAMLNEWYPVSQPLLPPGETRDDHLALFLKELRKVRVPTGKGDTLNKALKIVSNLRTTELPVIPGYPEAPESWQRIAALDLQLSLLCANGTYFLSYRDAARAFDGMSHQSAYTTTFAVDRLGVIKVIRKGQARANGGKAAEFRYLLPQTGNGSSQRKNNDCAESARAEEPPF
jgi:hypothetical protein